MGKTRAKQDDADGKRDKVVNLQIHGDAAFSGQGIVYESLALSKTPAFDVGGTIHIVCNNQVGFTTTPLQGRSSKYVSDIAKGYEIPVIHVNSDNPEEVLKVSRLAVEYRQKFRKDFLIDLIGYRRYGHNEVDEPEFTQPLMYRQIREKQVSAPKKYHQHLVSSNQSKPDEFDKLKDRFNKHLESEYTAKATVQKSLNLLTSDKHKGSKSLTGKWKNLTFSQFGQDFPTGINVAQAKQLGYASVFTPTSFTPHPRLQKFHIQARQTQIEKNSLDWATSEAIALASLVNQGFNLRFTGQDVERGTFSHRHLIMTDHKTEKKWSPLKEFSEGFSPKGRFELLNSPLSETGVLGYEYGYGLESPLNFVVWEAQFGDFFNTAQVVFDTFVTCSEAKWLRQTGIVVLLPHGFDGAGPEHSSCRIERFLQMGATDGVYRSMKLKEHDPKRKESEVGDPYFYANHQDVNFQFINPTTPANYFHALRRQVMRSYRKPLIVASPKICKISYEINAVLKENPDLHEKSALFVIEELLPFPENIIKDELSKFNKSAKVIWVQEEPYNSGAFVYSEPHLARILEEVGFKNRNVICHARRSIAPTATGVVEKHNKEHKALIKSLLQYN